MSVDDGNNSSPEDQQKLRASSKKSKDWLSDNISLAFTIFMGIVVAGLLGYFAAYQLHDRAITSLSQEMISLRDQLKDLKNDTQESDRSGQNNSDRLYILEANHEHFNKDIIELQGAVRQLSNGQPTTSGEIVSLNEATLRFLRDEMGLLPGETPFTPESHVARTKIPPTRVVAMERYFEQHEADLKPEWRPNSRSRDMDLWNRLVSMASMRRPS